MRNSRCLRLARQAAYQVAHVDPVRGGHALSLTTHGGHAHSLTTHHGLWFELSDPNVLVHMVWSGGRKMTFQIRRDDALWSRWLVVPLTVATAQAIGDEFLRG